jgi:hypothetical protein
MRKMRFLLPAIVLLLSLLTVSAQANIINNGSFEDPVIFSGTWDTYGGITGWSSTNKIEVRNNVAGTAYDGYNFVELDVYVNSSMSQTVTTTLGTKYTLSYYYAPRGGVSEFSNPIELWFNGGRIDYVTGDGNKSTAWILRSITVIGTGTDTISFKAVGIDDSLGGSLDNVSMAAVPLPSALLLLGPGLVGLIAVRRKFKN